MVGLAGGKTDGWRFPRSELKLPPIFVQPVYHETRLVFFFNKRIKLYCAITALGRAKR